MDDVLNSSASVEQSDSGTPKPTKQNASVGVNMDEEELVEEAMSATHLTPLEGLAIDHSNLTVSMVVPTNNQLGGSGGIMSGGHMVDSGQLGTVGGGDGQVDITGGINVQIGRGSNPHHIAMDSSGMCYATASMSQPLTTVTNGQHQEMGAGGMMQGETMCSTCTCTYSSAYSTCTCM